MVRSRSPSFDEEEPVRRGHLGVMGNTGAQLSMIDVHDLSNADAYEETGVKPGGGLSAKAGIILVSSWSLYISSAHQLMKV